MATDLSVDVNRFAPELSREEYDADKTRVRSTSLKFILSPQGPAAYYWNAMNPDPDAEPTAAMCLGTAVHEVMLDGKPLSDVFVVPRDGKGKVMRRDPRMKEYQDFVAAHPGVMIVSESEEAKIKGMIGGIARSKEVMTYLHSHSFQEQTILWTHKPTGILAKARLDLLSVAAPHSIVDLKTTMTETEWDFTKQFHKLKYAFSLAFYERARNAVLGDAACRGSEIRIITVHSKYPYWCYIREPDEEFMLQGHRMVDEAFARLAACRAEHERLIMSGGDELEAWPDDEADNQGSVMAMAEWMDDSDKKRNDGRSRNLAEGGGYVDDE